MSGFPLRGSEPQALLRFHLPTLLMSGVRSTRVEVVQRGMTQLLSKADYTYNAVLSMATAAGSLSRDLAGRIDSCSTWNPYGGGRLHARATPARSRPQPLFPPSSVSTPSLSDFSISASRSPSIRSIGGAPSRVASYTSSRVNRPVVISNPLVRTADHRPRSLSDLARRNCTLIAFALSRPSSFSRVRVVLFIYAEQTRN